MRGGQYELRCAISQIRCGFQWRVGLEPGGRRAGGVTPGQCWLYTVYSTTTFPQVSSGAAQCESGGPRGSLLCSLCWCWCWPGCCCPPPGPRPPPAASSTQTPPTSPASRPAQPPASSKLVAGLPILGYLIVHSCLAWSWLSPEQVHALAANYRAELFRADSPLPASVPTTFAWDPTSAVRARFPSHAKINPGLEQYRWEQTNWPTSQITRTATAPHPRPVV